METTLDLVESCLQDVYRIRKSSLITRSKQYREKMVRQQSDVTPLVQKVFDKSLMVEDEDENADEESVKLMEFMSKTISKSTSNPDLEAVFNEFCEELKSLNTSNNNLADEEELESACTYLIEKYFTDNLDKLPPSSELSVIKRKISSAIEELAAGNFAKHKNTTANVKDTAEFSPQPFNRGPKSMESEQRNIKKQYESYMLLRKKAQNNSEASTIEEYEKLNSEIKNVLSSIKGSK